MDPTYSVNLTEAEWNVVVNALADKPYRETAKLIAAIDQQITAVMRPTEDPLQPELI